MGDMAEQEKKSHRSVYEQVWCTYNMAPDHFLRGILIGALLQIYKDDLNEVWRLVKHRVMKRDEPREVTIKNDP